MTTPPVNQKDSCACLSMDAHTCYLRRHPSEDDEECREKCECVCHDKDDEDDDY